MNLRQGRQILRLAIADIVDERILSICMVFAIGAILAPLFILLGLKHGIIGNMLDRLRNDPVNRELRPKSLLPNPVDDAWFTALRERPDVAFVTPSLRGLGMRVDVASAGGASLEVNASPSLEDDPLLVENGARPPGELEITLSQPAAEEIGAEVGDKVSISVIRQLRGQMERASVEFSVVGVAEGRATMGEHVWLPFAFLRDVETWLAGGAVPRLGWTGGVAVISPRYDGLITAFETPIPEAELVPLTAGTGFYRYQDWSAEDLRQRLAREHELTGQILYWQAIGSTVGDGNVRQLLREFLQAGYEPRISQPWVDGIALNLQSESAALEGLRLVCAPPPEEPGLRPDQMVVKLNPNSATQLGGQATLRPAFETSKLEISVGIEAEDGLDPGTALVDSTLAGLLNEARRSEVIFDPQALQFLPVERGYRDFRLYARDINDVSALVEHFEKAGIRVNSSADAILRIRTMDGYLTQLYILIAVVAAIAGSMAIAANLYANVARKRADLAYLRLIGFSRGSLAGFPAHQALLLTLGAIVVASGAYFLFKLGADHVFRDQLSDGQSFCRLSGDHFLVALSGLGIAGLAAIVGAAAVLRIEVANSLRKE